MLKDTEYIDFVKKLLEETKMENYDNSSILKWEYMKFKIKEEAILYCKKKAKEKRNKIKELRETLNNLEGSIYTLNKQILKE